MLVIRLSRAGRKKMPFYHIVVAEKQRAVKKHFIEELGYYDPLFDGGKGKVVINAERCKERITQGCQPSETAARMLVKYGIEEASKYVPTYKIATSKPVKKSK